MNFPLCTWWVAKIGMFQCGLAIVLKHGIENDGIHTWNSFWCFYAISLAQGVEGWNKFFLKA
jgi:hypothetical protein